MPVGRSSEGPSGAGSGRGRAAFRTGVLVLVLVLGAFWVRSDVVSLVTVESSSMRPTLEAGDRLLVKKWGVDVSTLRHDDLVVFEEPNRGTLAVKRVVGLPGDVVEIRDARLFRDGERVSEPYVDHDAIDALYYGPVTIPAGEVLVMGDDRARSIDSRNYGPIPEGELVGVVWWRPGG